MQWRCLLFGLILFTKGILASEDLAWVNQEPITLDEFNQAMAGITMSYATEILGTDELKMSILEDLINKHLLEQEAKKLKVSASTEDITLKINTLKRSFPSSQEFQAAIAEMGASEGDLFKGVYQQILTDKIKIILAKNVKISDKEIENYIAENQGQFYPSRKYQYYQIIVSSENMAQNLLQQLQNGEDFSSLAEKYSLDENTASEGGLKTYVDEEYIQPQILYSFNEATPNQLIGPLKIEELYYLLKYVDMFVPDRMDFSKLKERVREFLLESKKDELYENWFDDVRKNAAVKIKDEHQSMLQEKIFERPN